MTKRRLAEIILAVILVGAMVFYGYQRWGRSGSRSPNDVLRHMPADAEAVLYIDLDALRQSPFLSELYKWAPEPKADPDYTQFLESTGFHYESDLHRADMRSAGWPCGAKASHARRLPLPMDPANFAPG